MQKPLPVFKNYSNPNWHDEFEYDIPADVAAKVAAYEQGPRAEKSSQQTQEELARLFEQNTESRKQYRFAHQEEFSCERQGKILTMGEFLRRLNSIESVRAHYTEKGGMRGTLGLYASRSGRDPQYICFVQVPLMQEYEEMHFDRYGVPLNSKRRGWRTVLLNLIGKWIITEQEAVAAFGEPATGPVSRRYRETLQYYRGRPSV